MKTLTYERLIHAARIIKNAAVIHNLENHFCAKF